jgi:hypothetical protein
LAEETAVVPERDVKTSCWMRGDGTGFISLKSNKFKRRNSESYPPEYERNIPVNAHARSGCQMCSD